MTCINDLSGDRSKDSDGLCWRSYDSVLHVDIIGEGDSLAERLRR